jgi:hypothetical protein
LPLMFDGLANVGAFIVVWNQVEQTWTTLFLRHSI